MSLKIRLARGGAKKRPYYRLIVTDSRNPRDGRFIERLGSYNPMLDIDHDERLVLDIDRIKHWLSVGARPSKRVERFLADKDVGVSHTIPTQTKKDKPKKKAQERLAAEEAKRAAEEEARAQATAEETA